MAHAYAAEGAKVLIADIATENGERVAAAIASKGYPGEAVFVQLNVTKREDWEQGLKLAKQKFGKLSVVINNAGTTYKKQPSTDVTEDDFDRIVSVNIKSIYLSVSVIMPYFVERKSGVFLSTSSIAGIRVRPGQVFYGGTKGFLNTVSPSSELFMLQAGVC
jgi:3-oxoacyl-[acyl-carrier protein] reductase